MSLRHFVGLGLLCALALPAWRSACAQPPVSAEQYAAIERELAELRGELQAVRSRLDDVDSQRVFAEPGHLVQDSSAEAVLPAANKVAQRSPFELPPPAYSRPRAPSSSPLEFPEPDQVKPLSLEERLKALEEFATKTQAEAAKKKAADASKPSYALSLEIQADQYWTGQEVANREAVGDIANEATAFRRARFVFQGNYEITEYRFEVDFALAGRPSFLDMYAQLNDLPVINHLRYGHYFEPFSLERLTRNRFVTFMERGLPDQAFAPARNLGVMAFNDNDDKTASWALGLFHPGSDNFGDDASNNTDLSITGRVTWVPYYDEPSDGRYYMHLGAGYSFRWPDEREVQFRAQPEARFGAQVPNVPYFVDTGIIEAENYQLSSFEYIWTHGAFSTHGEYFLTPVNQTSGPIGGPNLLFQGWYTEASYFLTGESRPYRREFPFAGTFDRIHPFENFFLVNTERGVCSGWGAWEVAARLSHLDLDDQNIQGGRLTDMTLGLNWYLNPYLRFTSNYVKAFLESPVNGNSTADFYAFRVQYDF